jgi:hypothetical protein
MVEKRRMHVEEVSAMSDRLVRLTASVAVAGLITLVAQVALKFRWELTLASCIAWLMLANVVRGRGPVVTTLIGIFAVVLTAVIAILVRFGIGWASAEDGATVSQLIEGLALMMAMQLVPSIWFTGWGTVPAGVITAFIIRRIMKTSLVSRVHQ